MSPIELVRESERRGLTGTKEPFQKAWRHIHSQIYLISSVKNNCQ